MRSVLAVVLVLAAAALAQAAQRGTPRADRITGTPKADTINARGGNDRVKGRGGDDVLRGQKGNDRLVGGRGADLLMGGPGDDRIDARDGAFDDDVHCGDGNDVALVDAEEDGVFDCERLVEPAS